MKKSQPRDEFMRKRMERQRRIRKRRLVFALIFFIILMIAVGVTLSLTVFFPIQTINVSGSEKYSGEEIEASTGLALGDNIFTFSTDSVINNIRTKLPYVEKVKIKRHLPGTLDITVSDAVEFACYSVDGKFYSVSQSGYVLNSYDALPENIIEIKSDKVKCEIAKPVEFSNEKSKKLVDNLINGLTDRKIKINTIDITDSLNISTKVSDRFIVMFGSSNNLTNKINHLEGMIKNLDKQDPTKTGKINLSMWTSSNTQGTFVQEAIN